MAFNTSLAGRFEAPISVPVEARGAIDADAGSGETLEKPRETATAATAEANAARPVCRRPGLERSSASFLSFGRSLIFGPHGWISKLILSPPPTSCQELVFQVSVSFGYNSSRALAAVDRLFRSVRTRARHLSVARQSASSMRPRYASALALVGWLHW